MTVPVYYASSINGKRKNVTFNTLEELENFIHSKGSIIIYLTCDETLEICVYDDYVE